MNGKRVNIPSYQVQGRATSIAVAEKAQGAAAHQGALKLAAAGRLPDWVEVDAKKFKGTFKAVPDRAELPSGHQREPGRRAVLEVIA